MEIARVYLDGRNLKVLLSGKYVEQLLAGLVEKIEVVYADMKSAKKGKGEKGVKLNIELATKINVATKKRVTAVKRLDTRSAGNKFFKEKGE